MLAALFSAAIFCAAKFRDGSVGNDWIALVVNGSVDGAENVDSTEPIASHGIPLVENDEGLLILRAWVTLVVMVARATLAIFVTFSADFLVAMRNSFKHLE